MTRNVAKLVARRRGPPERHPFTPEQMAALFAATYDDPIGPLLVLSASTGLRQGEALALRWEDVDLEAGTLGAPHARPAHRRVAATKTERSGRTIHLPAGAVGALREQRRRQLRDRLRSGRQWKDDGYVFATMLGTAKDARNVVAAITQHARCWGSHVPWHHLRHFAATALLADSEDLFLVCGSSAILCGDDGRLLRARPAGHAPPFRGPHGRAHAQAPEPDGGMSGGKPPNESPSGSAWRGCFVFGSAGEPGGIRTLQPSD